MNSSFEATRQELKRKITFYQDLVSNYPDNTPYQESLARLQQELAELSQTIGRGK